jgi:hypothetical protein
MSNSYPKLLEACLDDLDSPRGLSPAAVSQRIFDTLVNEEPSIADGRAFRLSELGQVAQRGLHEKVRKDIRNQTSSDSRQEWLFPNLDLRYTVIDGAGVERQIEHAHMIRAEWLLAERLLRSKAAETQRKADILEQCRLSLDHLWSRHPEMTSAQVFALAAAQGDATRRYRVPRTSQPTQRGLS